MKLIEVEIKGTSAFLMRRFQDGALDGDGTRRVNIAANQILPREEAEKNAYRLPDGTLYFPGAAIARLLREAGGGHKLKGSRKSLKYIVPASVLVVDDAIPFHNGNGHPPEGLRDFAIDSRGMDVPVPAVHLQVLRDFEVDSRPVTIPATKGRVMRHRPRLDDWSATFTLRVNETILEPATAHKLLTEGGEQIGIGDFRPEKGGPFGTFRVVRWDEKPQ